jgi:uncharacterized protein DUF3551
MRVPVLTIALIVAAVIGQAHSVSAQSAYSYPICAVYPGAWGIRSCYYSNYAQCRATMSGIGGACVASPYYRGPDPGGVVRVHARRHHRGN